jgi:hypothetical protein
VGKKSEGKLIMPITEQDAIDALELSNQYPDREDIAQTSAKLLKAYKSQQEGLSQPLFPEMRRREVEDYSKVRGHFTEKETHGLDDDARKAVFSDLPNEEDRAAMFSEELLARYYGRPAKEVRRLGTQYRDQYAIEKWGEPVKTYKEFFDKQRNAYILEDDIDTRAQNAAMRRLPKVMSWFDPKSTDSKAMENQKKLQQRFEETYAATNARISPYRQFVRQTVEDLKSTMDLESDGGQAKSYREFAEELLKIPKADRKFVLAAISANAGGDNGKEWWTKIGMNFERGIEDFVENIPAGQERFATMAAKSQIKNGFRINPEDVNDPEKVLAAAMSATVMDMAMSELDPILRNEIEAQPVTQIPDEVKAEAMRLADVVMDGIDLRAEIRNVAENDIDPAKGEHMFSRGIYAAARSIPYTAVAMVPGGMIINGLALQEQAYQHLGQVNPDMSRNQKMLISAIAAPMMAFTEKVGARVLMGKAPTLGRFLNQATVTGGSLFTRGAIRTAEGVVIEMVQENVQDVLPFVVQQAIAAIKKDFPYVPWDKVYGDDFWEKQGELFFAVLPLALVGGGAGSIRDFASARETIHNRDAVTLLVGDFAKADEIRKAADAGDYDTAQTLLRKGMQEAKTDSVPFVQARAAAGEALQAHAESQANAIRKAEQSGYIPEVVPVEGGFVVKGKFIPADATAEERAAAGEALQAAAGEVVQAQANAQANASGPAAKGTQFVSPVYKTREEANLKRWEHVEEQGLELHADMIESIDFLSRAYQPDRAIGIDSTGKRRTLLDSVNEGQRTREDALGRDVAADQIDDQGNPQGQATDTDLDIEAEYGEAFNEAERKALDEDDRLASKIIIGESVTEFKEGVYRTNIKVNQGATWATIFEEKTEGDAATFIMKGKRDWLANKLFAYDAEFQKGRLVGGKKLSIFKEGVTMETATDEDLKEAYSRAAIYYLTGSMRKGQEAGFKPSQGFRSRYAQAIRAGMSPIFDPMARFFRAIALRAARLNKMRREGRLDQELERELARSVGFSEQFEYEQKAIEEGQKFKQEIDPDGVLNETAAEFDSAAEAAFENSTDASFSVIHNATGYSGDTGNLGDYNAFLRSRSLLDLNEFRVNPRSNILFRPDRLYRVVNSEGYQDFLDSGLVRPNQVGLRGHTYSHLYAAVGATGARYKGAFVIEMVPEAGQWEFVGAGYARNAAAKIDATGPVRVFRAIEDGSFEVVHDNIGDAAFLEENGQTAGQDETSFSVMQSDPESLLPVMNRAEAERLFADGYSVYSFDELEEGIIRIESLDMMSGYTEFSYDPNRSPGGETSFSVLSVNNALTQPTKGRTGKAFSDLPPVTAKPKSHLFDKAISQLDKLHALVPDALESERAWFTFVRSLVQKHRRNDDIVMAPGRAMEYAGDASAIDRITEELIAHPDFVAARVSGLATGERMLADMRAGILKRNDLAGLLVWGLLSRGVGAYEQEGGFIVLHRAGLLDRVEQFFNGEISEEQMNDWSKEQMAGTPGASTSHNALKVGSMLNAMNSDIDGTKAIDLLYEAWKSDKTGPELRREIQGIFTDDRPALQISNKVISFIILVSGRPDVLVFDRVQFRHLWGGKQLDKAFAKLTRKIEAAKGKTRKKYGKNSEQDQLAQDVDAEATNSYDSLPVFDDDGAFKFGIRDGKMKVQRTGIAPLGDGLTGLAIYEAIERSISANVQKSYESKGIPYPGIGAFHWDSWLVESQQAIEHPTIKLAAKQDMSSSLGVKQGKFTRIESGLIYRYDGNYAKELLDGSGDVIVFSESVKKSKYTTAKIQKVIGRKLALAKDDEGDARARPWLQELTPDEQRKFNNFLLSLGERRTPSPHSLADKSTDGTGRRSDDGSSDTSFSVISGGRSQPSRDGGGRTQSGGTQAGDVSPLNGAPRIDGATGPDPGLVGVARSYAKSIGLPYGRQQTYAAVDEDRAARIAQAYEEMQHDPTDPVVAEAYANLIAQTTDQYRALESAGYRFWFINPDNDGGYADSPYNSMRDIRKNKSMGVFPTAEGFGSGATEVDVSDNPLKAGTGIQWPFGSLDGPLMPVVANDLFRAVHDAFGHGLEGAGFRARGEENAWQAHVKLFTGSAVGAITSETRGQNSWLNYGPYGEKNRAAKVEDTTFAVQKTGLMPEWTWTEGRVEHAVDSDPSFSVITNAESRIAESFNPFLRNPEKRLKIVLEAQRRAAEKARGFQEIIRLNRSGADIERERLTREADLMGEKLDTLSPSEIGALEAMGTLDDIGMRPILSDLLREKYYKTKSGKSVKYWRGSLMSKSAAERQGIDTKGGEWDGIPEGLPPYVWGGSVMPDQAASQFGFETTDEFWTALSAEVASYQNLKADTKAAMTRIRDLEKEAKAESKAWADEQKRLRKTVGTDRATLIAAMRTLDAMISALPSEIRGKIGGMVRLAQFKGPGAMLDELERRANRLDVELERWLKKEATKEAKDFFATVKKKVKTDAGKKAQADALPEMVVVMKAAEEAFKSMSAEQGQARGAEISGLLLSGKVPDNDVAAMQMMAELIPLFSGWNGRTEQQVINGKDARVRVAEASSTAQKFSAIEAAKKYWTEGMLEYKRQAAETKERRDQMREGGMEDVAKANKLLTRDEQRGIEQTRKSLPKKFALNIMTFDGFFRWHLGDDSKLYQWLTDSERKAANTYDDAVRNITKAVDSWFTEKAGSRFKGEKLRERMAESKTKITPEVGEVRTMSQLEMITAKLIWRQEDGKRHMKGRRDENGNVVSTWSYGEDFMAQIDEAISNEALELMDFLSDAYDAEYEPLNKVYRKLFGIDLPKHLLYSPLTVKPMIKGDAGVDSITGFFSGGLSGIAGALKTRGSSIVEPDFKDALQTYVSHSMQMEHFKAFAELSREARAILGRVEFRDQIQRASGEEGVAVLDGLLEILDKGGIRSSHVYLEATRTLDKLTGRLSTMILFGKLQTVALNVTQLAAASSEMGVATYWKQFGKLWFTPTNWADALRTPYIQRRIDEMPPVVRQVLESNRKLAPSRLSDINDKLGYGISASDGFFTAASYAMVYDWKQEQGRKMEMDGDFLETWARNETERIMDRIAQPTRKGARSIFENTLGPEGRAFFNFFSDSRKNVALASYAAQKDRSKLAGVAQFVFLNAAISSVIRAAWADLRDDDEEMDELYWNPGKIALEIAIDPLYGIPVVGGMLQDAIKSAFGFKVFGGSIFESGQSAIPATRRLLALDYDADEIDRIAADVNAILGAFGYFSREAAALTSITNVIEDALKVYDNLTQ